jgi:hypothetical protein
VNTAVLAHHLSGSVHDGPWAHPLAGAFLDEAVVTTVRHETELLAFALVGAGQAQRSGLVPDLELVARAERKAELSQAVGTEHVKEIALIFLAIGAAKQRDLAVAFLDAGIVPGGDARRAEPLGNAEQLAELHPAVTAGTRAGRYPGKVRIDERLNDELGEQLAAIERVVRNTEPIGDPARIVEVVGGTAAAAHAAVVRIVPEVQCRTDHVVTGSNQARRGHGRIDAPTHRDQHAFGHDFAKL